MTLIAVHLSLPGLSRDDAERLARALPRETYARSFELGTWSSKDGCDIGRRVIPLETKKGDRVEGTAFCARHCNNTCACQQPLTLVRLVQWYRYVCHELRLRERDARLDAWEEEFGEYGHQQLKLNESSVPVVILGTAD